MDCSLPASSAHGILQARKLEWIAMPFSKGVGDAAQTSRAAASGALESVLSTFQCSCKTPFNTVTFPDPVIKINIALSLLMFPILNCMYAIQTSQVVLVVKNLPANAG